MTEALPPLSRTVNDHITIRGHDLTEELVGKRTFTEVLLLALHGNEQTAQHVRVVDAVLVTVMEHGITPSTLAARLVVDGAPEAMESAIAAGLLASGSRFFGVIANAAAMLQTIATGDVDMEEKAYAYVRECIKDGHRVPGFGHNLHAQQDPRVETLIALARAEGLSGKHVDAMQAVQRALDKTRGETLVVNAAVAVAAVLSDLGYTPGEAMGLALVARAAGLLSHIVDEHRAPMARAIWEAAHLRS